MQKYVLFRHFIQIVSYFKEQSQYFQKLAAHTVVMVMILYVYKYQHSECIIHASMYPRSPNLCPEAVVDCAGKPRLFIQCPCLILCAAMSQHCEEPGISFQTLEGR